VTDLAGRVAVVTGGSRGIGEAIAAALYGAGAHVLRLARTLPPAEAERRTDIPCDVTIPANVERVAAEIVRTHGAPDILVNSAGVFLIKPLAETTPAEFAEQVAVNLTGAFTVLRAFLRPMMERGRGLVINVGSIADHTAFPGNAAYGASKTGLRGLHGVMAAELERTGVRATLLAPGPVDTTLWEPVNPDARPGFMPRAAMLRPADVADAALFIATRPDGVVIPELQIEPRR
jgi:NAD(P)-dependent dehydrogenase (short-subunit alcohol dehydrogenase family)